MAPAGAVRLWKAAEMGCDFYEASKLLMATRIIRNTNAFP